MLQEVPNQLDGESLNLVTYILKVAKAIQTEKVLVFNYE
jgi:hypothetical protein